tara:strand:+ start:177 stop:608 length:432 start_codon:yes stop_codon:yes gene_type:complete
MSKIDKHIDNFKSTLKKEGLKFTEQRLQLFKFLYENKGHFECEELIIEMNKKNQKVSRATIYRTLDILVKYNFVRKLVLDDGVARYENKISTKHHDHMICIETGDIIEFFNEDIERIQDEIAEQNGYVIVKHVHQLFVKPKNK